MNNVNLIEITNEFNDAGFHESLTQKLFRH